MQPARPRERLRLLDYLERELTRGSQDERRRLAVRALDQLDERHGEGERLARAGRRLDEHVAPIEDVRHDLRLDWERLRDAFRAKRAHHVLRYAELGE